MIVRVIVMVGVGFVVVHAATARVGALITAVSIVIGNAIRVPLLLVNVVVIGSASAVNIVLRRQVVWAATLMVDWLVLVDHIKRIGRYLCGV